MSQEGISPATEDDWVERRFKWYRERITTLEAALQEAEKHLTYSRNHWPQIAMARDCIHRALTQTEQADYTSNYQRATQTEEKPDERE